MKITPTRIPDVKLIEPRVFGDDRGFFMETWNERAFSEHGLDARFVQDNHSRSVRNTLRGLHYQVNNPQGKLVRVTSGCVFDVAVDIRTSSPTFGQWTGEYLSADNKRMLPHYGEFRAGDVRHSQADISKMATALGYQPTHRLREGITEAMPWYLANS